MFRTEQYVRVQVQGDAAKDMVKLGKKNKDGSITRVDAKPPVETATNAAE